MLDLSRVNRQELEDNIVVIEATRVKAEIKALGGGNVNNRELCLIT